MRDDRLLVHRLCESVKVIYDGEIVEQGACRMILEHPLHPYTRGLIRALTLNPELLVMDEPTAMLDASVQAHILNLLKQIQQSRRLTYLLITHDLDMAAWFADHMMIMQGGEVVEQGPTDRVLGKPRHPYTQYLIESFKI